MEISWCTPWQYCRIFVLPTCSTETGMCGAAGERRPAAAKPLCTKHHTWLLVLVETGEEYSCP